MDEYFGETQITDVTEVTILTPSFGLPSPTTISLPTTATTVGQDGDIQPDLEAFEGMLVTFSDTLSINEMFQLDRFNEIKLVQGERPFHFTQQNLPDTVGYQHHLEEVGARQITYDDGLALQNQLICNLDGFGEGPCQSGSFSTASNIRMGDTVTGLTGILYYKWAGNGASGATWRVSSVANNSVWFNKVNERPTRLPNLGGQYKLASLNVLNYFATIDTNGARTANEQEPRGADNAEEFSRQTEKLTRAILDMDVDVLGLVELENDFARGSNGNAIEFLVETLNAKTGDETFAWVDPGTQFVDSGDAISNGFIYKVSSIKRIEGDVAILRDETAAGLGIDVPSEGIFDGRSTSRAPIAVSFRFSTGPCITVALNHLKSKGSINGAPGNEDSGDGAGNNNANRLLAAQAIHTWLETEPTGNMCQRKAIIGDLNSYAKEDPITYLESVGYTDTARASNGDSIYSYVFDGQIGTLDYILVNRWLLNKVTGAATWNINADEPDAIDYNLDFGRDPAIFASDTPYRFSDHDALVVGMDL